MTPVPSTAGSRQGREAGAMAFEGAGHGAADLPAPPAEGLAPFLQQNTIAVLCAMLSRADSYSSSQAAYSR